MATARIGNEIGSPEKKKLNEKRDESAIKFTIFQAIRKRFSPALRACGIAFRYAGRWKIARLPVGSRSHPLSIVPALAVSEGHNP